jgi:hypothetical protein
LYTGLSAVTFFIEAAMERPKPPCLITVGGEEEETDLPYHKMRQGENFNPNLISI